MEYYYVRNWQKFQHYSKRNPPWIKLHYEILTSPEWLALSEHDRLVMVVIWLVASRAGGSVPRDATYLFKLGRFRRPIDFKPLIKCGFLVETLADASAVQANAPSKTETETETETEKKGRETRVRANGRANGHLDHHATQEANGHDRRERATRLPPDWQPTAEHLAFAAECGTDGLATAERFRDYWIAIPGAKGCKLNWDATWRNWCRRDAADGRGTATAGPAGGNRPRPPSFTAAVGRVLARIEKP